MKALFLFTEKNANENKKCKVANDSYAIVLLEVIENLAHSGL